MPKLDYTRTDGDQFGGVKKERVCLKCQKQFWSSWSGHRICPLCTKVNNHLLSEGVASIHGLLFSKDLRRNGHTRVLDEIGSIPNLETEYRNAFR